MASKVNIGDIVQKMALFGVGGWVAENALCEQDRYSSVFRGAKIPFMPVYAANGVVLTAVAPYVDNWPILARGFAYGILGTMVEFAGCYIDRNLLGGKSGSFGSVDALTRLSEGCVNFTRSALWGGMGLVAEKL
jgi:uncharacterized membrane protein